MNNIVTNAAHDDSCTSYRMDMIPSRIEWLLSLLVFFFPAFGTSQILQNFKFSSPAPVSTRSPAGPTQLNSTRLSCASLISATRSSDG